MSDAAMTVQELIDYMKDNNLTTVVVAGLDEGRKIHFQWTCDTMLEVHNLYALGAAFASQMLLFGDPTEEDMADVEDAPPTDTRRH